MKTFAKLGINEGKKYGVKKYKQGRRYLTNKPLGKKNVKRKQKGGIGMGAMMLAPMALPLLQGLLGGG